MARTRHLIPEDYPEESNKWYLWRIQECSYLSISRRRIDITKDPMPPSSFQGVMALTGQINVYTSSNWVLGRMILEIMRETSLVKSVMVHDDDDDDLNKQGVLSSSAEAIQYSFCMRCDVQSFSPEHHNGKDCQLQKWLG